MKNNLVIAFFACCLINQSCKTQNAFLTKRNVHNSDCGGFQITYDRNLNSEDSILIWGTVKECKFGKNVPFTWIKILNENDKVIDTAITNTTGKFKMSVIPGTYSISALCIGTGEFQSGWIDFGKGNSFELNIFLNRSPSSKD
ncbi:carboxypeptidase-like regulatory domain-containing protein [Chitinophaga polysaccharea]|uniref:carboxypeptidase-like regulatory domain-containing protein n=1 Tax=Chitinophaga polysaccharea TaxID=1293035 RepID=UPI001158F0F7|nr:carboxypeptidase-like regulatory domain-containing protein [Chitinophaga polysaccharea]